MGNYDFTKQPSLLIQGAMDTETAYFIEHLEEYECVTIETGSFTRDFSVQKESLSSFQRHFREWSMLRQRQALALAYFKPWAVINQGIGGGHDKKFLQRGHRAWRKGRSDGSNRICIF